LEANQVLNTKHQREYKQLRELMKKRVLSFSKQKQGTPFSFTAQSSQEKLP
jgi:hypothetical protein